MAPPAHTSESNKQALQLLINCFLSTNKIRETGIFDVDRIKEFLMGHERDKDPVSLVRKDALINHILGIHILQELFIEDKKPELAVVNEVH